MRRASFVALTAALVGFGCAGDAAEDERAEELAEDTSPAATAARDVGAMLHEWRIEAPDTIDAGLTRFGAMNHGTVVHGLEVEGEGIEEEVAEIQPGGTAQLLVELKPGVYELYCPVEDERGNHKALGMTKQLVVR